MITQIIYERTEEGAVEIARIQDGKFSGPFAEKAKEILVKNGWPEKPAHWILWGDYLWATLPIEDSTPGIAE